MITVDQITSADPNASGVADTTGNGDGQALPELDSEVFNSMLKETAPAFAIEQSAKAEPKEDPERLAFHQSRADKAFNERDLIQRENEFLKRELESRKALDPLLEVVRRDPEAYQFLKSKVEGQAAPKAPVVEAPKAPEQPANFSSREALEDPNSPSAKYMREKEAYIEKRLEYLEKLQDARAREYQSYLEQQQAMAKQAQQAQELKRDLVKRGFAPEEAEEFLIEMSKPESLSLENLMELWNIKKGRAAQVPAPRTPVRPPVGGAAIRPVQKDENQMFNESLKAWDDRPRFIPSSRK